MAGQTRIEVEGLDELLARMQAFPNEYNRRVGIALASALAVLWEKVRPYPRPPEGSKYKRTGTLGRKLGTSMDGNPQGHPSIFAVKSSQGTFREAEFGARLDYAPRVIGDGTQQPPWVDYWWNMQDIARDANDKIIEVFEKLAQSLARFLEGKGIL